MGWNTIALFDIDHRFEGLEWLRDELAREHPELRDIADKYGYAWRPKAWAIERVSQAWPPSLVGPGGFTVDRHAHVLEVYHLLKRSYFACVDEHRVLLRRAFRLFADTVGSAHALYTHECMPYPVEATGVDAIAEHLLQNIGPCAVSFEEFCEADDFGPRAWFVDTFVEKGAD